MKRKETVADIADKLRFAISGRAFITAEEFATKWDVPKSIITQALAQLNREGLVGQRQPSTCHDKGCWHPSTYPVIKK